MAVAATLSPVTDVDDRLTRLGIVREAVGMARAAVVYPWGFRPAPQRRAARLSVLADLLGPGAAATCTMPVVLVPGYMGNHSNWYPLERRLALAGFTDVHCLAYVPIATTVEQLAERLADTCRAVLERSGSDRLHVVGHSLGGVLVRYAAQRLGLAPRLATAVTIATPHRGVPVAVLGRGAVARALRPRSPLYDQLEEPGEDSGTVRWVAYYSNADVVAPPRSARLVHPALSAENVLVPDQGHLSILRASALLRSVPEVLRASQATAAVAGAAHAPAARPGPTAPALAGARRAVAA
jgi:pimeloyl-ACP methyl ester carboxylesterase